jgi:hypothetical protein
MSPTSTAAGWVSFVVPAGLPSRSTGLGTHGHDTSSCSAALNAVRLACIAWKRWKWPGGSPGAPEAPSPCVTIVVSDAIASAAVATRRSPWSKPSRAGSVPVTSAPTKTSSPSRCRPSMIARYRSPSTSNRMGSGGAAASASCSGGGISVWRNRSTAAASSRVSSHGNGTRGSCTGNAHASGTGGAPNAASICCTVPRWSISWWAMRYSSRAMSQDVVCTFGETAGSWVCLQEKAA